MKQFIEFNDKVCIVTGAGSETGIGFRLPQYWAPWEDA